MFNAQLAYEQMEREAAALAQEAKAAERIKFRANSLAWEEFESGWSYQKWQRWSELTRLLNTYACWWIPF